MKPQLRVVLLNNIKSNLIIISQPFLRVRHLPLLPLLPWTCGSVNRRTFTAMATEKQPLKKRDVVSSFIFKNVKEHGQRKPRVALFRRSNKVNTYQ